MSRTAIGFILGLTAALVTAHAVEAQAPAQQSGPDAIRVVAIQHGRAGDIAGLMNSISRGLRCAWDDSSNSLVLAGSEHDIAETLEVVKQLDVEPRAPMKASAGPHSMRVTVFYVEGDYEEGGASEAMKLPSAIEPAAKVLTDNGIHDLRLLTSQIFNVKTTEKFNATGTLDRTGGYLRIYTEGWVKLDQTGQEGELRFRSNITQVSTQGAGKELFEFETTLMTRLGDYVIVGASPTQSDGQKVLAIILKVEGDRTS